MAANITRDHNFRTLYNCKCLSSHNHVLYVYIFIAVVGSLTPALTKVGQLREELEKLNILPEAMELNQAPDTLEEESPLRIGASRRAKDMIPPFIPYFFSTPRTKKCFF